MKFEEYPYKRIDYLQVSKEIDRKTKSISDTCDISLIKKYISDINEIKKSVKTLTTIANIRHTINTNDEFYNAEMDFIYENENILKSSLNKFNKVLLNHKLRKELEEIYGSYYFKTLELSFKTYDDSVSELLVKEAKLSDEYDKLMASCEVEFDGKINNLSQLKSYSHSTDRNKRFESMKKINEFLDLNEDKLDNIYDELVHIRHEISIKLGYNNFIELAYDRMGRTDYNSKDVENYRKQVVKYLVPLVNDIVLNISKSIGIEKPKYYDLGLEFLDGNPIPKGTTEELVNKALNMYSEMSKETKEYFNFMVDSNLLDLETKKGKQNGGYCTFIPNYNAPFIFSNFNGTSGDVDVLTHEAGHGFMAYLASKEIDNPDLIWPTCEACEIHSMSMEFLAYPWMKDFFLKDTNKYYKSHTNQALIFIPYGCAIDHFQHLVFENPNASAKERKEMWKYCEKLYTPWRDMEGLSSYEKGNFWFMQLHVFEVPFYYIDYTLAQISAFEFYVDSVEDRTKTWERYLKLCKMGGSDSYLNLISKVGLHNPFEEGSIEYVVNKLKEVISTYKE